MAPMSSTPAPPPSIIRLAQALTDRHPDDALVHDLTGWLSSTPRFRAFATTYRAKIHKKVRSASDAESLRDVRAELLAARLLLTDKRFAIEYEAYGSGKGGPDLTVTFRSTTTFNVEVTRLRKSPEPGAIGATLLAKLRQLPPSAPNVLVLASARPASAVDVGDAVRALRVRADARDDASFERSGSESSRGFYERFLRLSAVIGWSDEPSGGDPPGLWSNPSARIPLPERVGRACAACFGSRDLHIAVTPGP
jgi:hypothetical protein